MTGASENKIADNNGDRYILEMIGITKEFPGVKALDGVTFRVRPGTVHSLMGENGAGKSTLMKCLFGMYKKDSGEVYLSGSKVEFQNSKQALDHGVSMVHQELNQVPHRSIMDNIWLGRYPSKGGFIEESKMYDDTKKIFEDLDIDLDPRRRVNTLSVSQKQMVEIAKAVSYDSRVIVMDEPTSSLTEKEVDHLFRIIDRLRKKNVAIIYISHKMEEILKISDDVTIMRDGKWISTENAKTLTIDGIIKMMVGRDLSHRFPERSHKPGGRILEVSGLTSLYQPSIKDITFDLREGEVLGVAGLVGAKRTDILEALFGIRKVSKGEIILKGKKCLNTSPAAAMTNGFAMVTEERRATGIFDKLSVNFNSIVANLGSYVRGIILDSKSMEKDTQWVIDSMSVKTPGQKTQIGSLSGGNQQKVIIGRWLLTKPDILLLDEPTRGIDVGAKFEIYQLMNSLAAEGKAIIMVSSEMPELIGVTDRILVMSNGRLAGIVETKETDQEEIMRLSAMYL
jgi:methyl-galactoside transport system ATP-binding protein